MQKLYLATDSDRLKLLVLYSGEDDERLRKAAAGTLAVLTGDMPELCVRIPSTVSCFSLLVRKKMTSFNLKYIEEANWDRHKSVSYRIVLFFNK